MLLVLLRVKQNLRRNTGTRKRQGLLSCATLLLSRVFIAFLLTLTPGGERTQLRLSSSDASQHLWFGTESSLSAVWRWGIWISKNLQAKEARKEEWQTQSRRWAAYLN